MSPIATEVVAADLGLPAHCVRPVAGSNNLGKHPPTGRHVCCLGSDAVTSGFPADVAHIKLLLCESQPCGGPDSRCVRVCIRAELKGPGNPATDPVLGRGAAQPPLASTFSEYLSLKSAENQARYWEQLHSELHPGRTAGAAATVPARLPELVARLAVTVPIVPVGSVATESGEAAVGQTAAELTPPTPAGHGNLCPLYGVLESSRAYFAVMPYQRFNLQHVLMHTPDLFGDSHAKPLFVLYQVLLALRYLHGQGVTHGRLCPANISIDQMLWVQLVNVRGGAPRCGGAPGPGPEVPGSDGGAAKPPAGAPRIERLWNSPASLREASLAGLLRSWVNGWTSNYEYLMALNHLAGRRLDDPNHHPVLPWVTDFSSPMGGWRDLSKSKFRLNKGDVQLDVTFAGDTPHHISDVLSELTYYVYMARRTTREVLCRHVRQKWVPEEYPSSMDRMYDWTPDECIPAFYTDSGLFRSTHDDLCDLAIPAWADSPEDFVRRHAEALESDYVSEHLHEWIDLTFGYKLSGRAAIEAKNVVLLRVAPSNGNLRTNGVVQLFARPHPSRALPTVSADVLGTGSPLVRSTASLAQTFDSPPNKAMPPPAAISESRQVSPGSFFDTGLQKLFSRKSDSSTPRSTGAGAGFGGSVGMRRQSANSATDSPRGRFSGSDVTWDDDPSATALSSSPSAVGGSRALAGTDTASVGNAVTKSQLQRLGGGKSERRWPSAQRVVQSWQPAIPLPYDFRPLSGLQQLEGTQRFLSGALGAVAAGAGGVGVTASEGAKPTERGAAETARPGGLTDSPSSHRSRVATDMRSFGVVAAELYLGDTHRSWCVRAGAAGGPAAQEHQAAETFRRHASMLPSPIRQGVRRLLLAPDGDLVPHTDDFLHAKTPHQLISFPEYFPEMYRMICEFRSAPPAGRPDVVQRSLKMLHTVSEEGFAIVLPLILGLFEHPDSCRKALDLFDAIASRLHPTATRALFADPLVRLHEQAAESDPVTLSKLFGRLLLGRLLDRFGPQLYLEHFVGFLIDGVVADSELAAAAALEGIQFVTKKVGALLTARFVVRPLLRLLARPCVGRCLEALASISAEFGEAFICEMYGPFLQTQVEAHSLKMVPKSEGVLANCVALMRATLGQLAPQSLLGYYNHLSAAVLQPLLQAIVSVHSQFPDGTRPALTRAMAELMMCISRALGRENSQDVLLPVLQLFFSAFDWIHATPMADPSASAPALATSKNDPLGRRARAADTRSIDLSSLSDAFAPPVAAFVYSNFCQLIGQETMRRALYNNELVEQLMYEHSSVVGEEPPPQFGLPGGATGSSPPPPPPPPPQPGMPVAPQRILDVHSGWRTHWDGQVRCKSKYPPFQFQQLQLQTFQGHSGAIRATAVAENEAMFLSGSKDRTVKLWSTAHRHFAEDGGGQSCRRTYLGHRKPISDVLYSPTSGHVVSSDGSVHVWDPESGYCLRQFELGRNSAVAVACTPFNQVLIAGTVESSIRFLDVRTSSIAQEWLPGTASQGSLRTIAMDPDSTWVAVGFSTGHVRLLDARTGLYQGGCRAHESDVLKLAPISGSRFLTTSVDHTTALWRWKRSDLGPSLVARYKGQSDPVHCVSLYKGDLYTVSAANRMASFSGFEEREGVVSADEVWKLKAFKGAVTSMDVLPLNQAVLLGSDTGVLSLWA